MNEETKDKIETTETNYIDTIKKLKANSVDKEEYNKVLEENKQLLNALTDGKNLETDSTPEKPKVDIDALRKELYGSDKDLSNLDYIQKTLTLRNDLIEKGEPDPFLPLGSKIVPTDEDIACANRVADAFQHCIDYAEGDSEVFTNELQRIMVDVPIRKIKY